MISLGEKIELIMNSGYEIQNMKIVNDFFNTVEVEKILVDIFSYYWIFWANIKFYIQLYKQIFLLL